MNIEKPNIITRFIMLFKSDNLKKSDSKSDLMEEKLGSVEVDNLDLGEPKRERRKWHVFSIVLLVTVLALASWTMIFKQYRSATLSPTKIEDQVFETTMRVVSEAELVLQEVRNQAEVMCRQNKEAALKYVTEIRDTMKERTQVGVKKVDQVVEENLATIKEHLVALQTTTQDIFNGLVDILQKDIDKVFDSILSAATDNDQHLAALLDDAILQAQYEVRAMWKDLDDMYTYYTSYSTGMIEDTAQNMTNRIVGLVNSQRRSCDCTLRDRVNMCYNISAANIETSKTIEKVVHVINRLYNTTDSVNSLLSMRLSNDDDQDKHSAAVRDESASLLEKYKKTSQQALESLLVDHFCFLGSAVRVTAENTYPHIKRFILRTWRTAIKKASAGVNATLTDEPLIKDEYRRRMVGDSLDSLRKLATLVKTKAALVRDEGTRNQLLERADFNDLVVLMDNRFRNVTDVINAMYSFNLWNTKSIIKSNVEFIVDQRVPFVSSLAMQNYLPTDVCPLAMDFAGFVFRFLNADLYRGMADDELDRLMPEQGYAYVSDGPQADEDTSAPDTDFEVKIFIFDVDSAENETAAGGNGAPLLLVDQVDNDGGQAAVEPVPFVPNELESKMADAKKMAADTQVMPNLPGKSVGSFEKNTSAPAASAEDTGAAKVEPATMNVDIGKENSNGISKTDEAVGLGKPSTITQNNMKPDDASAPSETAGQGRARFIAAVNQVESMQKAAKAIKYSQEESVK